MAEPTTIQKLIDASLDSDSLEVLVNADENTDVNTRLGKSYPSAKKALRLMTEMGIGFASFESKALMTASAKADGTYAVVTNDIDPLSIGAYLKKSGVWQLLPWNNISQLNSHTINTNKHYPFRRLVRKGENYDARKQFLESVLDMRVYNADPNYYYSLTLLENGSTSLGGNGTGLRIEKALRATYATTGASIVIHNNPTPTLTIDRVKSGVQHQIFKCLLDDVYVEIVFNVDKLPAQGTAIASTNIGFGYNWIIDEFCYRPHPPITKNSSDINSYLLDDNASSLDINSNKKYPFEIVTRDATAPINVHPDFKKCILDAEIIGARRGYSYRLSMIQNGADKSVFGTTKNYGISVSRTPNNRLNEGYDQNIVTYTDESVQLVPDRTKGGRQSFYLQCPDDPITSIRLVIDVDVMPPDGTAMESARNTENGYNSIIDSSRYTYADDFDFVQSDVFVDYSPTDNKLKVAYLSGAKWYQIICARKAVNSTFTPLGFGYAPAYTKWGDIIPPQFAVYALRVEGLSDYHAPISFTVDSGGDTIIKGTGTAGQSVTVYDGTQQLGTAIIDTYGKWFFYAQNKAIGTTLRAVVNNVSSDYAVEATPPNYTAGSHGSDGYAGGYATAEQKELRIVIDGALIDTSKALKCIAKKVECISTVAVMASNTVPSKRFALEQNYVYTLSTHGLWISCNYKALQALTLDGDNGCQHYLAGMTPTTINTYLFWGGKQTARQNIPAETFNSGLKPANPDVFGISTRHPISGEFISWVDTTYGIGNRQHLNADRGLYEYPRIDAGKIYPRLISTLSLQAGEGYKWRGGYYWGSVRSTTQHDVVQKTQAGWVMVKNNGEYAIA